MDDGGPALAAHHGQRRAREEEGRVQVLRHDVAPVGLAGHLGVAVAAAMPDVAPPTSTAFPLNVMAPPIAAGGAADKAAARDAGAPVPEIRRFGPAWASFESSGPIVQVDRICLNSRHYPVA